MYFVWHNYVFNLLLFYYWLRVSESKGHHQANIYAKRNILLVIVKKLFFGGSHLHLLVVFTIISSLQICYL